MKTSLLLFSLVLMFIGLSLGYIYLNPFGFVIDGIGFVIFLYALFANHEEPRAYSSRKQYLKSTLQEDYRCGNCWIFGQEGCKRNEKVVNAEPCEDYVHKSS